MPGTKTSGRKQTEKPFRDMLAFAIQGAEGNMAELRKIAEQLVKKAVDGDIHAIKEVADRLDGKAHQSTDMNANLDISDPLAELIKYVADRGKRAINTD